MKYWHLAEMSLCLAIRPVGVLSIVVVLCVAIPMQSMAQSIPRGTPAGRIMCPCPGQHKPLGDNATCEDACYGSRAPGGHNNVSSIGYEAGRQVRRWLDCKLLNKGCESGISPAETARRQRQADAWTANERGVEYYNNKEWEKALAAFQDSLAKDPSDETVKRNIYYAQEALAIQRNDERQRHLSASSQRMQQSVQDLAQSLNPAASAIAGGLDVDGRDAVASAGGGLAFASALAPPAPPPAARIPTSGDARVVDARNVPSGLDKATEDAIAGAYANAPPGVSDRVRKGFQAVMERDWKVARAWFQDALRLDHSNAGLQRLIALSVGDVTPVGQGGQAPSSASTEPPMTEAEFDAEMTKLYKEALINSWR